jgi:hypothetical protein
MSRVDDRIRRELTSIRRPVRDQGAFELVEVRRRRVRLLRRVRVGTLALVVLVGTAAGVLTLQRIFDAGVARRPPGDTLPSPQAPTPTMAGCDRSSLSTDLDGDGRSDSVVVSSPAPSCESPDVGAAYEAHVETAGGARYRQALPECDQPFACRLFAGPDIDGDGAAEVAIARVFGVSSVGFSLYRFAPDAPDGRALHRFEVAEPGDRWDPTFGLRAGPATFTWYGSVTHLHWLSCDEDPQNKLAMLTALRDERDPSVYRVHGTLFDVEGVTLRVGFTWDERIPEEQLVLPEDRFCGARILPPS